MNFPVQMPTLHKQNNVPWVFVLSKDYCRYARVMKHKYCIYQFQSPGKPFQPKQNRKITSVWNNLPHLHGLALIRHALCWCYFVLSFFSRHRTPKLLQVNVCIIGFGSRGKPYHVQCNACMLSPLRLACGSEVKRRPVLRVRHTCWFFLFG